MHLLSGIYDYDRGSITINGVELRDIAKSWLRRHVQIVLQEPFLFSKTIYENIHLSDHHAMKEDVVEAARMSCIHNDIEEFDQGYETMVGEKGVTLSGGQKQRVAIAGVIAMEPKCIVLDEPTAMLDPNGRKEVLQAVARLRKEKNVTVILITHYMEEVIHANKVYVMDGGNVVMQGTPREIFSQVETLKKYRLDVPQVTLLAHELHKAGVDIPEGILTKEELVGALCR